MKEYFRGMEWLNEHKPFFYEVAAIAGKPVENMSIDTAQVSFIDGEILFEANPEFLDTLSDAEIAGVISHEAYHIILNHLEEATDKQYTDAHALMIAHEIIINDSLSNSMFLLPDFVLRGKDYIDDDASNYSTREAYDLIEGKYPQNENKPGLHEPNQMNDSVSGNGVGSEDFRQKVKNAIQEASTNIKDKGIKSDADSRISGLEEVFDLVDDKTHKQDINGSAAGDSASEEMMNSSQSFTTDWAKVLEIINPDFGKKPGIPNRKVKTDWYRQDRRLVHMYPKILAPTKKISEIEGGDKGNKPIVLLAMDFSGSIPRSMTKVLSELGQSIPLDMFEVYAVTFSTNTVEFDVTLERNRVAGGGTDFSAVEKYAKRVQKETGEYPFVIAITDGQSRFYNRFDTPTQEQLKNNWFWFAINNSSLNYMKNNICGSMGFGSRQEIFYNIFDIPHKNSK